MSKYITTAAASFAVTLAALVTPEVIHYLKEDRK